MHSRRDAFRVAAAPGSALALPAAADSAAAFLAPSKIRKPPRLRPGDVMGLVEPAEFTNDPHKLALIKVSIVATGLAPKVAPHVAARWGYLAGRDNERAADIVRKGDR